MHHEKEVTSQVLHGQPQPKRYFNVSVCTLDRRKVLICWYSSKHVVHVFRKIKARVSLALQLALNTFTTKGFDWILWTCLMSWVVVKYEKMRFLATLRRATFYISLSRGSAIGTLLNVTLLAYASDKKLYPAHANFPNHANRSSQKK